MAYLFQTIKTERRNMHDLRFEALMYQKATNVQPSCVEVFVIARRVVFGKEYVYWTL